MPAAQREQLVKLGFQGKAAIYLPEAARFGRIASLPQGADVGAAIDHAMDVIEAEYAVLAGALPRGYTAFETDLLAELVKIFDRPAIRAATGDVFGRIYEYFPNKFAMNSAQEGGEFFTPPSLVRMIVNVIEPDHGLVLDPACGAAGMFVQTGHFIEDVRHAVTNDTVTFHGQEKSDSNARLARMNLVVHGLDASNIRQGNTFYDQISHLVGQCDFVMTNPPFNVDGVDTRKVEGQVGEGGRLPFGLPGTNGKTGAISNANSLWIQYFYSYLNATGRAGFVMASSASDAGNKDRDIREKLVRTDHVDVMVAIGTKFFYTRSLPCTLWFFDKGKPQPRRDTVLMIDARNVYHVVSANSHVFTEEQLANRNATVWLYRGEAEKFVSLVQRWQRQAADWLAKLPERQKADDAAVERIAALLRGDADQATRAELNKDQPEEAHIVQAALDAFRADLAAPVAVPPLPLAGEGQGEGVSLADCKARQATLDELAPQLKAQAKAVESRHKHWLALLDRAEKTLRARLSPAFDAKAVREAKRALLAADAKKKEAPTVRDAVLEALKQAGYFIAQAHWLDDLPALLVPRVCRLRGKPGAALTNFIRYVLAAPEFSAHVHRITTGANIPHISGGDIAAYEFLLPSLEQIETLKQQNRALTRDLLLPKLMSGQLDVSGIALPEAGVPSPC